MVDDLHMTLVFENDDAYKLIIPQVKLGKSVNYDYIYHSGTYELKETTLKLYITYNVSSAKTEEYEIEFDNNKIVFINKISGSPLSETFYKK